VVIHNPAKLTVNMNLKVFALRPVVIAITVVAPGDDFRMISDRLDEVDVSGRGERNHQLINP
jgi:hypothetical protein